MKILLFFIITHSVVFAQHSPINIPRDTSAAGSSLRGLDPNKAIINYIHRVWQAEQGLPQNSAQALCQTRDGYLWIGTEEGLVRFDGIRFTVFNTKNTPGLKANAIQALLEDRIGRLWIGTNGGGVSCMSNGQCRAYTTEHGLAGDFVSSLLEDRTDTTSEGIGTIWVGTLGGGVSRLNQGKCTNITTKNGLSHDLVFTLMQDRTGAVWIGTNGGGVNRWYQGSLTAYTTQNGLSHNLVRALLEDHEGVVWIGTFGGGLIRFRNGVFTTFTEKEGLAHNLVWSLKEDQRGTLWIGTFGGGLCRYRNGKFSTFSTTEGLSSDLVRSIAEDREGVLWVGTVGGLNSFKDGLFTSFSTDNGLSHDVVRVIMENNDHFGKPVSPSSAPTKEMWIGTFGGGINLLGGNTTKVWTTKDGLSSDIIYTMLQEQRTKTSAGALWIGTNGGGVNRLENGVVTRFTTRNGLSNDVVFALAHDRDKTLWVGTNGGGLNKIAHGKITALTTKNGLSSNNIRTLLADSAGGLWIGTVGGGLNYLKNNVFTVLNTNNGLSHNNIRSLFQDSAGTLWIGTVGGGLNRYRQGKFTTFTSNDGLFDDLIHCILEDDFGYLWMSCNKGIFRVRKVDLEAFSRGTIKKISCESFGTNNGMRSAECNSGNPAGWKDREGHLWFATMAGAVRVNPEQVPYYANRLAPPVIIEQVLVDDVAINITNEARIDARAEKFEWYYTATSLFAPERVKFKYCLEGYDKQWVDAGLRRTAYYNNLPRGREYRFRVIACNNDAVWNEVGASAKFYLEPHFWETWWFYATCGGFVLSLGFGTYRVRVRRLQIRAQALEKVVRLRTAELRESNEEIQKHLEELDKQAQEIELSNITLREKNIQLEALHQEKNDFLGIVVHDLKNPLASISLAASSIRVYRLRNPGEWIDDQTRRIEEMTGRMMGIITNLLDVNALESGNYAFHNEYFDLAPVVTEIVREYQHKATEKQIIIHTELPTDGAIPMYADMTIVQGIMDNLLSNAVKYSPHGKNVFVRIGSHSSLAIGHWSGDGDSTNAPMTKFLRIEVQDEGLGISEEDQAKLFGKFVRLSAKPTGGEHSTGLGLSIIKKMAEAMNGRVWCESELGKGATFIVELPQT
ncbi:MAG: two-component regulator propeller domain-containing protein [Candidatus Kapaibacteriota bacterium]